MACSSSQASKKLAARLHMLQAQRLGLQRGRRHAQVLQSRSQPSTKPSTKPAPRTFVFLSTNTAGLCACGRRLGWAGINQRLLDGHVIQLPSHHDRREQNPCCKHAGLHPVNRGCMPRPLLNRQLPTAQPGGRTSVLSARLQAGSSSSTAADRRSTLQGGSGVTGCQGRCRLQRKRAGKPLDRRRRLTAGSGPRRPGQQTQAGGGAHLASRCTPRMAAADQTRRGCGGGRAPPKAGRRAAGRGSEGRSGACTHSRARSTAPGAPGRFRFAPWHFAPGPAHSRRPS